MIAPYVTDAGPALRRFQALSADLAQHGGSASSNQPVAPSDGYTSAEMYLGSRLGKNAESPDAIYVMSYRTESDGEHILTETFVRRREPSLLDRVMRRPGPDNVYHILQEYVRGTSGSQLVDAVLARYDPRQAQRTELAEEGRALDRTRQLESETGLRLL
ncbi:MAG: hypothetical protein EB084_13850 [Proteobacteria bacterium]|nr:hypothetical protein [Pseudomonadota bacterium]